MVTQVNAITTPVPSKTDPVNFSARGDTFLGELPIFQTQLNTAAGEINTIGDNTVAANALAQSAKTDAENAAIAAKAAANYKAAWLVGTTYAVGDSVLYTSIIWVSQTDANTGTTPGTDDAIWLAVVGVGGNIGDFQYAKATPGDAWAVCDGSLRPLADADATLRATINAAQLFQFPEILADATTLPNGSPIEMQWADDGSTLAILSTDTPHINMYTKSADVLTKLANPASLPSGSNFSGIAISGDGVYSAVASQNAPYLEFFKRTGSTVAKLTAPATLPTGQSFAVAMTVDGVYCAVGTGIADERIAIYKRAGDTWTQLVYLTDETVNVLQLEFSQDGLHLISASSSTGSKTFDRSGDTFTLFEAIADSGNGENAAISGDGLYIVTGVDAAPSSFSVYKRGVSAYAKLPDTVDAVGVGAIRDIAMSADGLDIILCGVDAPHVEHYRVINDLVVKSDNLPTIGSTESTCGSFSGGKYLAVGKNLTPYFEVYRPIDYDSSVNFRMPFVVALPCSNPAYPVGGIKPYIKLK
jgi:hypothetical protein